MSRILVIEDEFFVAAFIDNVLSDSGHEVVGPVGTLNEAKVLARAESLDGALLDVNIDGGRIDDVADILVERQIPFLFVTGFGRERLPPNHRSAALLEKPFTDTHLIQAMQQFNLA